MQCAEFEDRLQASLDRRRAPAADPRLAAHAQECAECCDLLAAYETLFDGLAAASPPVASADLLERVVGQLALPEQRASIGLRIARLAIAAALVLAVGWTVLNRTTESEPSRPTRFEKAITNSQPAIDRPAALPIGRPPIEHASPARPIALPFEPALASTGDPPEDPDDYLTVVRRTGWAVAKLPATVRRATQIAEVTIFTDPIRPVANSMSAVFDALRRTLPSKPELDSKS